MNTDSLDDDGAPGLSRRSQAVGIVLSLLLVGLTVCLLGLLLHKRERRSALKHIKLNIKLEMCRMCVLFK